MEELITAITASSLTLHWQLHTSCSSASTNLKWPVTLPAQFNTKKLKLVKESKEKNMQVLQGSLCLEDISQYILEETLLLLSCRFLFLLYTKTKEMHKHPRNVGIPE